METGPKLTFKYGWDERDEAPIRLQQDLKAEVECGSPFLAPPGLIVIPELTRSVMENAIAQLWKQGYFDALQPLAEVEETLISHS